MSTPISEQPDLAIIPYGFAARSGTYRELPELGQPNGLHPAQLIVKHGTDLSVLIPEQNEVVDLDGNALLEGYGWLSPLVCHAGRRLVAPTVFLGPHLS